MCSREADDDIYATLTEVLPSDWRIHIHCYTDTLELAKKLLAHFPNLVFGISKLSCSVLQTPTQIDVAGVVTYASNKNTTALLEHFAELDETPRFVLETGAFVI
jgi:TatD DNase family protein